MPIGSSQLPLPDMAAILSGLHAEDMQRRNLQKNQPDNKSSNFCWMRELDNTRKELHLPERWAVGVGGFKQGKRAKQGEGNWLGPRQSQRARLVQPSIEHNFSYAVLSSLVFLTPTHATCQATSLKSVNRQLLDLSSLSSAQVSHGYIVTALNRNISHISPKEQPFVASTIKLHTPA